MQSKRSSISSFLTRHSLREWATTHRIINGRPFAIAPALQEVYDTTERYVVVRKAAQVGISEWLLNNALWIPETRQGGRGNSLYVFPAKEQGEDFSKARIDKAIDESPYLTSRTGMRNVGLKKIGEGFLYVRGAQNRKQMLSVDADAVMFDEIAEYNAGTVETMVRRLGSSTFGWIRAGSTPRYPSDEAAQLWEQSTQAEYHVRCTHCGQAQPLTILDNLNAQTARVECRHCHGDMTETRLGQGVWIAAYPDRPWRGFQMNKLLYPLCDLTALAASLAKVQDGRATVAAVQEFYNSDCGVPYLPKGGHLGADALDACRTDSRYTRLPDATDGGYMGVDVGARHHVVIDVHDEDGRMRLVHADAVETFADLDPLMHRYDVVRCVIDANPETESAQAFAARWPGRVYLAYYPNWTDTQRAQMCLWDDDDRVVKINRTLALDHVMARVQQRRWVLPWNARELGGYVNRQGVGEFYQHLGSPIRVIDDDGRGNAVARYAQNGPDHFCHATVYALAAASAIDTTPAWVAPVSAAGGWSGAGKPHRR